MRDCVSSILSQDVENLRVLIIDNGSTDDSVDVARRLAAEDDRVHVVHFETNRGPQAAYNYGIDWASADYFLLIDADDVLAPGALARAIALLERDKNVVFAHGVELLQSFEAGVEHHLPENAEEGSWRVTSGHSFIKRALRRGCWTVGATTVIRRTSAQKQAGHYSAQLPDSDDLELWLRMALLGDVAETTAVQAVRRVHGSQITTRLRNDALYEVEQIRRACFSFLDGPGAALPDADALRTLALRGVAKSSLWAAVLHFRGGKSESGERLMRYAVEASLMATLPRIMRRFWLFSWPPSRMRSLVRAVWGVLRHGGPTAYHGEPHISPRVAYLGEGKKR
ncbi:hyaluronan synthase [Hyphomicrobium denitrificans 1NES1]|uniref:Hyaluronan synthase n=1 Tax=Hyphomicrobium denitrificans 1NES1 TaxID=670307 RepID=N0BBU0_9HYPH|nr:hyaluronan synthase [Hyphomicrobium denitrificans 1NES1]